MAGDLPEAVDHLRQGLAVDARLGARPFVVRGRIALARALLATGNPGEAVELVGKALSNREIATRLFLGRSAG